MLKKLSAGIAVFTLGALFWLMMAHSSAAAPLDVQQLATLNGTVWMNGQATSNTWSIDFTNIAYPNLSGVFTDAYGATGNSYMNLNSNRLILRYGSGCDPIYVGISNGASVTGVVYNACTGATTGQWQATWEGGGGTPTPTPEPLPESAMLEGLQNQKQAFNNCGPANLTIVLNFLGNPITQEEAASYLKPNQEDRNVSPWQIVEYVNEVNPATGLGGSGLQASAYSGGNMAMLKQFIANGMPVVIEKGYEPSNGDGWYGHYLTVIGYDDAKGEIYSLDTNLGPFDGRPRVDTYEEFEYWWQQFNYTFYVVYEADQQEIVAATIPAGLLEPETMWQYTADLAQTEIDQDPENVFAWFNLGVSLTRLGEISLENNADYYLRGTEAFDQARAIGLPTRALYYEHRPFMAYWKTGRLDDVLELADAMLNTVGGQYVEEIYWYQGHALVAQGNIAGARAAYEKALEVNPNFSPAQTSLDWIMATYYGG